jgi:hypothetical protein
MVAAIRITVTLAAVEGDHPHCVDAVDIVDADVTEDDLATALVEVIQRRAETARYGHKPRPELSEFSGR